MPAHIYNISIYIYMYKRTRHACRHRKAPPLHPLQPSRATNTCPKGRGHAAQAAHDPQRRVLLLERRGLREHLLVLQPLHRRHRLLVFLQRDGRIGRRRASDQTSSLSQAPPHFCQGLGTRYARYQWPRRRRTREHAPFLDPLNNTRQIR